MTADIVIIGGGFGGFWSAVSARRVGGRRMSVALVSRSPFLELRPRLYQSNPERLRVDLRPILDEVGVRFVPAEASGADLERRIVETSVGPLAFQRLVVATGSVMATPAIAGVEHAYSIDSLAEAVEFDAALRRAVHRGGETSVTVVGGGFTGIELALELRERVDAIRAGASRDLRVTMIDPGREVGAGLGERPRPVIADALAAAGVEVRLGLRVTRIDESSVQLGADLELRSDLTVLATGTRAAGFTSVLPVDRDDLGRIPVDQHLEAIGVPGLFVAGDAAHAYGIDDHLVMQSCQHALQLGRFAGENAARSLLGRPLLRYGQPTYVTCLDLGDSGAVFTRGWDREVAHTGEAAKTIKTRINTQVIHPPEGLTEPEILAHSVPSLFRR
ncbi:NAD(P)/FAD-dependent oxidoreductase [Agromyces silvae]|uniref:NAD(P)/FAD-dependent oxidoreductase n=1 Tax=Agromyces silvae TaxID=3388266 RepID=UPI00280BA0A8|nr:FAD-dependent oxidoreductase [Agromyces protaetiae]